jgi:hypothetical protein
MIFVLIGISLHANSQIYRDLHIINSINELSAVACKNNYLLRTNSIKYTIFTRDLDTINNETICFLDSLSKIIKIDSSIVRVDIYVHLSIKEWSSKYSINLDKMWKQIINYLENKGISRSLLNGRNFYNTVPIKNKSKEETDEVFFKYEYKSNRRVEFKFSSTQ